MKRLVFDTSTEWVVAGIWDGTSWIGSIEKTEAQTQSKQVFVVLQELLEFYQIPKKEISEIGVGIGPGSYTGLRIGLTVAKIWAYSAGIPLYKFSSARLGDPAEPKLQLVGAQDFERVEDINAIVPVYSNDHFS